MWIILIRMSRELILGGGGGGGKDTHSRGGKGVVQPALKTRPSVLSSLPPLPCPRSHSPFSAEQSRSWLCHQEMGPSSFPGLDSPASCPPTHHCGSSADEMGGCFQNWGPTHNAHCPRDDPALQNPELQTTPPPSLGLPLPKCCQCT